MASQPGSDAGQLPDQPQLAEQPTSRPQTPVTQLLPELVTAVEVTTFPERFPGQVLIDHPILALRKAHCAQLFQVIRKGRLLVLWTDGWRLPSERLAGAAVVHKRSAASNWVNALFKLDGGLFSGQTDAELFAINAALWRVKESAVNYPTGGEGSQTGSGAGGVGVGHAGRPLSKVVIYSGCLGALLQIDWWVPYTGLTTYVREPLLRDISKSAAALMKDGVAVELRWVPGNQGGPAKLPETEHAHLMAEGAARKPPRCEIWTIV